MRPTDWPMVAASARIHQIELRSTCHPARPPTLRFGIWNSDRHGDTTEAQEPWWTPCCVGASAHDEHSSAEGLYSKLEDAAEAAGLTVAEYCVVELAASHDFELPNTNSDQLPLAIGA